MTDLEFEQDRILDRAKKYLVGGRVYDWVPDEFALPRDAGGTVRPYLVVTFPPLVAAGRDRSLGGEEDQPQVMTVVVSCWGGSGRVVRQVAGAVRKTFVGWAPSTTSQPMSSGPAGGFQSRTGSAAGTLYLETATFTTTINLGGEPGAPEDPDPTV